MVSLDSSARSSQHRPTRPDVYYELARAYARTSNFAAVVLVRGGTHTRRHLRTALKELATAAMKRAGSPMRRGRSKRQSRSARTMGTHLRTSATYLQQGHVDQGRALRRALTIDADLQANNTWALRRLRKAIKRRPRGISARCASSRTLPRRKTISPPCRVAAPIGRRRTHFEKAIRSARPTWKHATVMGWCWR